MNKETPYSSPKGDKKETEFGPSGLFIKKGGLGGSPHVRLLALHVIAAAIKYIKSADLLLQLPSLIEAIVPSLSSALVDIRKSVILILVESYLIIGDALYPFVSELQAPQKKLLTIYIEKERNKISSLS
jgi:hypothetical protein